MKLNYALTGAAVCVLALLATISSCKKKTDDPSADYDRTTLLMNLGNNIIIPNYQALKNATYSLDTAVASFVANPTANGLSSVQDLHKAAYRAWQSCSYYEFGPATDYHIIGNGASLRGYLNQFPCKVSDINTLSANTNTAAFDIEADLYFSVQGFPALDYLLFGVGTNNTDILAEYATASDAAGRKNYLSLLSSLIATKVNAVYTAWIPTGGNYVNTFVANTGTADGSSISVFLNAYIEDYEILKNYRLGTPLGKLSNGVFHPEEVEAYYSGISTELAKLHLNAAYKVYLGNGTSSTDSTGFDDCVNQVNGKSLVDGAPLNNVIKDQFKQTTDSLALVPTPLALAITNSNVVEANRAYIEVVSLLVYLKNDLPSALSIVINFGDNDGD